MRHGAVDNLQQAAAREQFVFHQGDVGFHAGRVAVHEKGNRAGRREHRDLRVAKTRFPAAFQRAVPALAGFLFQIIKFRARLDGFNGFTMLLDDAEH